MIWKILTAQIRENIYYSLTSHRLLPDEQKGCCKRFRRTTELLHLLHESKTRRKNLARAWIDIKKAYDMVKQRWMINCLKMFKISHEVIKSIEKTMKTRGVQLTAKGRNLFEIKIVIGAFGTITKDY